MESEIFSIIMFIIGGLLVWAHFEFERRARYNIIERAKLDEIKRKYGPPDPR